MKRILVIGAGVGGLAAAARLAKAGHRVTVIEKTERAGGRMSTIQEEGYTFDTGPSLFLMPETYRRTYHDLGVRMEDCLDLVQIDPTYRLHFHDGSTLSLSNDMIAMRDQLDAMEPGAFQSLLRFLEQGYRRYYGSLDRFVGRNFNSAREYFSLANLPLLISLRPLVKHYAETSRRFRDPRLRAAFSFQNMYLGLSPYDAPATYTLLQYTELAEGVWYPRGGMYGVVESLLAIAEGYGAQFEYNTPVEHIDVEGSRAVGVTLEGGERLPADIVIANADLPYAYGFLLPSDPAAARIERLRHTSSALMFYWGVRGERSPQLLHHNVFLSEHRYEASFRDIFSGHTLPAEPSFYIHAPVRTAPTFAPPDHDALMVLVPTGHLDEAQTQDWPALQERAKQWAIERLEAIGVEAVGERTTFERTITPPDYRRIWNLSKGAAFGLSHNLMQVGYLRPKNRHATYGNLYFVGASTHPGTGVPMVLLSAQLVTERVLEEQAGA
jgi:phytoene desaturase